MASIKDRVSLIPPDRSLHDTILQMAEKRHPEQLDGVAVVVSDDMKLLGVLTDGDIRRCYARSVDFSEPVSKYMIADPVYITQTELRVGSIIETVAERVARTKRLHARIVRFVPVLNENGVLMDVVDVAKEAYSLGHRMSKVAVYGMGYVGVTLGVVLANRGHFVTGIDRNPDVCEKITNGNPEVYEPGLVDMLTLVRKSGRFSVQTEHAADDCNVHIVAVGTPVDESNKPSTAALDDIADTLGDQVKPGDLVQLRSTVPVGYTRRVFVPRLERRSSLKAGDDFFVAFAPERTAEGQAIVELTALPQIVGGYSNACEERSTSFWSTVTRSVVRVGSLEAAEIAKLANNTFRDLSFAFANELALTCDAFNIDASTLIDAANEGYPRNSIPRPSPGVGGYCLTKDPLLYGHPFGDNAVYRPKLGLLGREVNDLAAKHVVRLVQRWADRRGLDVSTLSVLLIGMAFKGQPETNDLRGSTSILIERELSALGADVHCWDAVLDAADIRSLDMSPAEKLTDQLSRADAICLLNNHIQHTSIGLPVVVSENPKPRLVFDGWSQLDRTELESIPQLVYATMGYMTPPDRHAG